MKLLLLATMVFLSSMAHPEAQLLGLRCQSESNDDPYHKDGSGVVFKLNPLAANKFNLVGSAYILPSGTNEKVILHENLLLASNLSCSSSEQNPRLIECLHRDAIYNPIASLRFKEVRKNGLDMLEMEISSPELKKLSREILGNLELQKDGSESARTYFLYDDCKAEK